MPCTPGLASTMLCLTQAATPGSQATLPPAYDEKADAHKDLAQALEVAKAEKKQVLVVFGANWCPDCRILDAKMKAEPLAPVVKKAFVVVKVDIGRRDKHADLAERFGVPLKKGIPAVAVVDAEGKALKVTAGGELANARGMGDAELVKAFEALAAH